MGLTKVTGSPQFSISQEQGAAVERKLRPDGPAPEPDPENVAKARAKMVELNEDATRPRDGVEWREGDWLFWVYPGGARVLSFWKPAPAPTEDIPGKMVDFRSTCTEAELTAMDCIANGREPPESPIVDDLKARIERLEAEKRDAELVVMDDMMAGGDGNIPQTDEQRVVKILGEGTAYSTVTKMVGLMNWAKNRFKSELGQADRTIAALKKNEGRLVAEIAELRKTIHEAPTPAAPDEV